MEIRQDKEGDAIVLNPDGDLNTPQECGVLERELNRLFEAGSRCFVIDCGKTPRVSAAAIRLLLLVQRRLSQMRGCLVLCGLGETARRVFAISGFDRDFTIVASRSEAVSRAVALALEREHAPAPPERPRAGAQAPAEPGRRPSPVAAEPSPVAALAAGIADLLAAGGPAGRPLQPPLGAEALERLSARLMLALAARRA